MIFFQHYLQLETNINSIWIFITIIYYIHKSKNTLTIFLNNKIATRKIFRFKSGCHYFIKIDVSYNDWDQSERRRSEYILERFLVENGICGTRVPRDTTGTPRCLHAPYLCTRIVYLLRKFILVWNVTRGSFPKRGTSGWDTVSRIDPGICERIPPSPVCVPVFERSCEWETKGILSQAW